MVKFLSDECEYACLEVSRMASLLGDRERQSGALYIWTPGQNGKEKKG